MFPCFQPGLFVFIICFELVINHSQLTPSFSLVCPHRTKKSPESIVLMPAISGMPEIRHL